MDKLKVIITNDQKAVKIPAGLRLMLRRCCTAVLRMEHFQGDAEVNITFTDDEKIREMNNQFRHIDAATDVLSFPLGENGEYDINPDTGCKQLGDIVISVEHAVAQANEFGHTFEREMGYLTVLYTAARSIILCSTPFNRAAVHGKRCTICQIHTAAAPHSRAAINRTAVHDERAAFNIDTAAYSV